VISLALALACVASGTASGKRPVSERDPVEAGEDDPTGAGALLRHLRNVRRHGGSIAAARSADRCAVVGDVAVIANRGDIIQPPGPPRPFDLTVPVNLVFDPTPGGYEVSFAAPHFVTPSEPALAPADDDAVMARVEFPFTFFGVAHSDWYVISNGNITFTQGDIDYQGTALHLVSGPPRIAPFFLDLDPSRTLDPPPSIHLEVQADLAIVSWMNVPEFETDNVYTFQAILHADHSATPGRIEFAYLQLPDAPAFASVIGVAEGNGAGPVNDVDYDADLPADYAAGAIFEEFYARDAALIDTVELARVFYACGHEDRFDQLILFTDFVNEGVKGAFHSGVRNDTSGIGVGLFDQTRLHHSAGELESVVFMNRVGMWSSTAETMLDPPIINTRVTGDIVGGPSGEHVEWLLIGIADTPSFSHFRPNLYFESLMGGMGHETGHRWLTRVRFRDERGACEPAVAGSPALCYEWDLLGRENAHWSVFFNSATPYHPGYAPYNYSDLEGSHLIDCEAEPTLCDAIVADEHQARDPRPRCAPGKTLFVGAPHERGDGFAPLDLYQMGLMTEEEVGPFWYVSEPRPAYNDLDLDIQELARWQNSREGVFFCGNRVDLTVDDIVRHPMMGPRISPASLAGYAYGDEVDTDVDPGGAPVPGEAWSDLTDARGNPDVKTGAYILVVDDEPLDVTRHAGAIRHVDLIRRTYTDYVNGPATGHRARFNSSLRPARW
jgi:hypothetical protein